LRYEGKERKEGGENFNGEKSERLFLPRILFPLSLPSFLMIFTENHHGFSATSPAMKMKGRASDFCGMKEKREENVTMILM
jgi:hypothetical protein